MYFKQQLIADALGAKKLRGYRNANRSTCAFPLRAARQKTGDRAGRDKNSRASDTGAKVMGELRSAARENVYRYNRTRVARFPAGESPPRRRRARRGDRYHRAALKRIVQLVLTDNFRAEEGHRLADMSQSLP